MAAAVVRGGTEILSSVVQGQVEVHEPYGGVVPELASRDQEQRSQIDILTRENLELRAGARWPEWITGAGILGAGMLMGAILHSITGRRSRPRIRL